jgi:hypothetical protein
MEKDAHRQSCCVSSRLSICLSDVNFSRWSAKFGKCPSGDPDLQHYIGDLLFKGKVNLSLE